MTFTARRRHPAAHPLSRLPMLLALGLALGLPGCGGSDGRTGAPGPDGTGGVTALLEMATEPAGTNCANGGTRVSAGLDADADTVLSAGEISDVKYICSGVQGATGASGTTGLTSLVTVVAEPAGSNCLLGGSKITAGLDASANGVLELAEVSTTNHVCNGDTGAGGATGAVGVSGVTSLVTVVAEPAGAHCTAGGNRASVGLDSNRDSVLDVSEISSISYMCHGETGATGSNGVASLIAIVSEPAGVNCAAGGSKATAGPDTDRSAALDLGEVTSTSYVCHGAAGVPATSTWVEVSTLTAAAQPNTGYLANNASQVVITLPASPNVGDVVQVTGLGEGGWKIAQNAGQTVITQSLSGGTLGTARADARSWSAMAASADGSRLVATAGSNPIYTSADSGLTWTATTTASAGWSAVASSADGSVLAAVANGGSLIVSTDSGANWTARDSTRNWTGVAMSADGSKLVALAYGAQVYTSADSGATWTARDSVRDWTGVASSADGTLLVAAVSNGLLYTSSDSGATWTGRATSRNWKGLASSADGNKLLASVSNGSLYTSTDAGVTWTAREASRSWRGVTSSTDGNKLLAAASTGGSTGGLFSSTDGGVTWSSRQGAITSWTGVAMNDVGTRLFAAASSANIYTFTTRTTTGTAGSVVGGQYDSIALQYAGGGVFLPISSVKYSGVFIVE